MHRARLLVVCLTTYHITLLLVFVIQVLNSTFTLILILTGVATKKGHKAVHLRRHCGHGWRPRELDLKVAAHSSGVIHGGRIHCLFLLYTGCGVDPLTAQGSWFGADSPHYCPDRQQPLIQPISLPRTPFTTSDPSTLISSTTGSGTWSPRGRFNSSMCPATEDQRADFLTKALRGDVFWRHVRAVLLVIGSIMVLAVQIRPED
jgi:hypothetical protein